MARDEKRRDPGEFYPGGKVWVKPGHSQPQVRVTWQQIEGKPQIAPLPDRYKDGDVKEKVNEIASKFATVVVAALVGWTAVADITVQKKRKDQLYNDDQVVVDVTGSGVGVDTNAVRDIVRDTLATNGIRSVDGAARPLPKYLHLYEADDSYPDEAEEYYRQRGSGVPAASCSSVRDGGFLYRNFDYPFDDRAEFVVKMSEGKDRFASVGVAQVGTNLTEQMVTSGKPEYSRLYKWLPGATVDGINENGVACNINVVDGPPQWGSDVPVASPLHPLAAIRWILDNATNAQHAAEYIASHIRFPQGWQQNFHYMVADESSTYIVENGSANSADWDLPPSPVMTNFPLYPAVVRGGAGWERYELLTNETSCITNAWFTRAYAPDTEWLSEFHNDRAEMNAVKQAWESLGTMEARRKVGLFWQTVHTSVYDLTNRVLRICVQETDDWYVFSVPPPLSAAGVDEGRVREIVKPMVKSATNDLSRALTDSFDAKLEGKLSTNVEGGGEIRWGEVGDLEITPEASVMVYSGNVQVLNGDVQAGDDTSYHSLSAKANRPNGFYPQDAGNIAALDENGDLVDSGKKPSDFIQNENGAASWQAGRLMLSAPFEQSSAGGIVSSGYGGFRSVGADYVIIDGGTGIGDHSLTNKADRSMIHHTNPTFSNAVMSVATGISTNDWAVIASVADWARVLPGGVPGGAGTLGAVLAALAAAVLALKKKTSLLKSDGTAEDDFATDLFGKPVAITAIDARIKTNAESAAEPTNAVTLNDNAPKTVTVATVESPATPSLAVTFGTARNGGLRICELYILNGTADTDLTFDAETVSFVCTGDSFPACEAGINYFVFAEVAANLWKVTRETLKSITTPTFVAAA